MSGLIGERMEKRIRTKEILAATPKADGKLIDATAIFEARMLSNIEKLSTIKTIKKKAVSAKLEE